MAFVEAFNNSLNGPFFSHYFNLAGVNQGDGVNFSIYYNEVGNELSYVITPPTTSGTPQFYKTQAYGAIFDHAAALDDFTDSTGTPIALPPFVESFRINQFLQGAITTENGTRVPSRARGRPARSWPPATVWCTRWARRGSPRPRCGRTACRPTVRSARTTPSGSGRAEPRLVRTSGS